MPDLPPPRIPLPDCPAYLTPAFTHCTTTTAAQLQQPRLKAEGQPPAPQITQDPRPRNASVASG
eukprot:2701244-Prorocentrum_lima.AAC.1